MSGLIGDEGRENLKSLKEDLVGPVKSFLNEVQDDTLGDARRFYALQARRMGQSVRSAREKAAIRREAQRREQEELRKRRKAKIRRAAIIAAVAVLVCLVIVSAALSR